MRYKQKFSGGIDTGSSIGYRRPSILAVCEIINIMGIGYSRRLWERATGRPGPSIVLAGVEYVIAIEELHDD